MFNAYEFIFAGESSFEHGMMLYDIGDKTNGTYSFGNKASIIETRIVKRIQPLHFGVNYNGKPLEFKMVFGSEMSIDRYVMEEISLWLTGYQDYQWLTVCQPDLADVQFRCLITELSPIAHGWLPVAFEATVVCDCPYAYSREFERRYNINGKTDILFRNDSSVREYLKPMILFSPAPNTEAITITNQSDNGRVFQINHLPSSGLSIIVDNKNGIINEERYGYNLYDGFNLNFFRLIHGDNQLVVEGDGVLAFTWRFFRNVGG